MRSSLGAPVLAVFLVASACSSSDDDAAPDASVDASRDAATTVDGGVVVFAIDPPAPPAAPTPPALTPCPEGFAALDLGRGFAGCEPLPGDDGVACPAGQARFVGETGCQPIGSACPAGPFADDAPVGALFVDATAAPGGDGTRARPFRSALEAYPAAAAGTTIMLSRGDHTPLGLLPSGLSIRGACVSETRVVCGAPVAGVDVDGDVSIEEVTFDDCQSAVYVRPDSPAHYRLTSLAFERTRGTALNLFAGEGVGESLVFAPGLRDEASDGTGWGLGANLGARFVGSRISIENAVEQAVLVSGEGTDITLDGLSIRDTRSSGLSHRAGSCLVANYGASLTVRRALLDGCRSTGVSAALAATVVVEDAVVRDIGIEESDETRGMGVLAQSGSSVTLHRVLVEDTDLGGVWVLDPMTTANIEDVVVRRAEGHPTSRVNAFGLEVALGATVTGARVAIYDLDGVGVFTQNEATRVTLDDLQVFDIRGTTSGGQVGYGVTAYDQARLTLSRARIERVRIAGLIALIDGVVVGSDVSVVAVRPQVATGIAACAVCALGAATIRLDRAEVIDVDGSGIGAAPVPPGMGLPTPISGAPSSLSLTDVVVRDIRLVGIEGGSAIDARGSTLVATRVDVSGAQGVGILAAFDGATMDVSHARVHDILAGPGGLYGYGIDLEEASGTLRDVLVERARGVGVFVSSSELVAERLAAVDIVSVEAQRTARAMNAQASAHVTVTDAVFARTGEMGVFVHGAGTTLTASRVSILDIGPDGCDTCVISGVGVGAFESGHATLSDFLVTRIGVVGVQVAGGDVDLSVGEVSESPIGANVTTPGFELSRLQDRVVYRDNGVNLDSSELPVPAALAPPDIRPGGL